MPFSWDLGKDFYLVFFHAEHLFVCIIMQPSLCLDSFLTLISVLPMPCHLTVKCDCKLIYLFIRFQLEHNCYGLSCRWRILIEIILFLWAEPSCSVPLGAVPLAHHPVRSLSLLVLIFCFLEWVLCSDFKWEGSQHNFFWCCNCNSVYKSLKQSLDFKMFARKTLLKSL